MYNGHSILGTGMAFEQVRYPDFYQIFQVASCLSYEYYVRPVLSGKGSWDAVDIVSNTNPTYYNENLPLTSTILAKLFYGFENQGRASWQDIMEAVSARLYHNRFGVSGARGNRFHPDNNQPDRLRYSNNTRTEIPDDDANGVSSTIEVPDRVGIESLSIEIDLTHTYVGDLKLVLSHDGVSHTLWNQEGDSADDIRQSFSTTAFNGQSAGGTWTLHISDRAARDVGALQNWTLVITPAGGEDPDPEQKRFENTTRSEIPDNDEQGVFSRIEIGESLAIGSIEVELDVTHSYISDLSIVLTHDGTEYALWEKSGGGSDDIRQSFKPTAFDGQDARGTWQLHLVDHMNLDQGALNRWALVITPAL
jgi:subtilisin-like proprotein convertase family protein